MASLDDYDFSSGDAGADVMVATEAGQIRVGGFIVMKGAFPCKVSAVSVSKTGKHGHAKCNFTAIDIFTGKKYEDIIPSTHTAHVPFVKRGEYSVLDISDEDFLTLMDEKGDTREDIKLPTYPDGLGREIQAGVDAGKSLLVTVISAMKTEQVVGYKEEAEAK